MRSLDVQKHQQEFFALIQTAAFSVDRQPVSFQRWLESTAGLFEAEAQRGGRVFLVGNGASQAMSSHYAADLTKNALVPALALSDAAMLTCFANDYSYETALVEMLKRHLGPADVLVAISSSGRSPNVVAAANYTRQQGRPVVALTGFSADNPLRQLGSNEAYLASRSYGMVECGHAYLMHALLDMLCERRGAPGR